jgi:hypothetical protein
VTGRFLAGNSGNGGRKRGSRNKLGEAFLQDLYADWQQHGPQVIETCRRNKPEVYLKVVASLLPKELEIKENPFDGFTDDELAALIAAARDEALLKSSKEKKMRRRTENSSLRTFGLVSSRADWDASNQPRQRSRPTTGATRGASAASSRPSQHRRSRAACHQGRPSGSFSPCAKPTSPRALRPYPVGGNGY